MPVLSDHSTNHRCEAAYYFPKDMDVCHAAAAPSASAKEEEERTSDLSFRGRHDELERRNLVDATPGNEESTGQGEAARSGRELEGRGGEGTLVLHVRSGDIFDDKVLAYYGQVRTCCEVF